MPIALDPTVEAPDGGSWWRWCSRWRGDVFLMLPGNRFVEGLASFLVGHLAYIGGMVAWGLDIVPAWFVLVALLFALITTIGGAIVQAAGTRTAGCGSRSAVYITVITIMVLVAGPPGTGGSWSGRCCSTSSDATIGITRFVRDFRVFTESAMMVTYHLAQFLLVFGLTRWRADPSGRRIGGRPAGPVSIGPTPRRYSGGSTRATRRSPGPRCAG